MKQPVDVLAFGTHPDDLELCCGGTLILLARRGYRVGAVDLTRGELGTRGSAEIRTQETAEANRFLNLIFRENLGIPDGNIEKNQENLQRVIEVIRTHRPRLVLAPLKQERHYDHVHASELVSEAAFYSGLAKIDTGQEHFRPFRVLYYTGRIGFRPSFIVDVSDVFEDKMRAVRAYRSQFHGYDTNEPETLISSPYALEVVETMARHYGAMIGAKYGEPFRMREALEISDPVAFFRQIPDGKLPHLFPHQD
jgi:bacillithiol biosynthesis deacetylase BshB1